MRFKLDENLGRLAQELFQEAGHEVHTVHEEGLQGTPDPQVLLACQNEQRCLATLDLNFANPVRFPPEQTPEIVVLRLGDHFRHEDMRAALGRFFKFAMREPVQGRLLIVTPKRIRMCRRFES